MYPVAVMALAGLVTGTLHLSLGRPDITGSVLLAAIAGSLSLGCLGTLVGATGTFQAIAMAAPDQKWMLAVEGIGESLSPITLALGLFVPQALLWGAGYLTENSGRRLSN
jgi:hypothetical protein